MSTERAGAESPLVLDPTKPMIVSAWGRKGSGKSFFNRRIYASWPYDKLAIDVNGNAEPGEDAERVTSPLPKSFPTGAPALGERRRPRNLHYRADPGSATYYDDLDRAVGMALFPQDHRALVWGGEVGELMPNGKPGPAMRRLLQQNRHYKITGLFDGPRPVFVDPLVLAQSDLVAVYHLPNPKDQDRIADSIGYSPAEFRRACQACWRRGPFNYLLWDAAAHQLWDCDPLPDDLKETA